MKVISFILITLLIMGSVSAFAGPRRGPRYGRHYRKSAPPPKKHSPKYRRIMRDLDRQYREGSLTRTEYIQRKREIKDLGIE
ncbi:MAG: hypothetical protein PVH45_02840 [Candidatus Omnitrophota bacterium]